MSIPTSKLPASNMLSQSRGWLIFGGFLSILVGFVAMGSPYVFSFVIAQFLGIFVLITGAISILLAIFGKHTPHRILEGVVGLIRVAAGVVLLNYITSTVAFITLIFAIFLAVEGVLLVLGSIQLRANAGWIWILINGIASLLLGILVFNRWPGDSMAVLGTFFGIFSIFSGMSRLMLGVYAPKPAAA